MPEAVKTALLKLATYECKGKLFIVHLVDAPPHEIGSLDNEGKKVTCFAVPSNTLKEKEALGERFDWLTVVKEFSAAHPDFCYSCLTTRTHPFYSYLAQVSQGGSVHPLSGDTTPSNIRKQIARLFNGLFGLGDSLDTQSVITSTEFAEEQELSRASTTSKTSPMIPDKYLSGCLLRSVKLMKFDADFVKFATDEFEAIIRDNPLSLTISPVLGKMWREFCKRRSDPKRDELIELLSKQKHSLGSTERSELEEWLKDSYDSTAEIEAELKGFMGKKETQGLLRFVPEDESLCAQQIVQLLAAGDVKSTSIIRAILSRLYIDNEYHHPICVLDDEAAVPLPPRSIPLNMNSLFYLSMHTVAPGTKFTSRYASLLALHAIQCGSVLAARATDFLKRLQGKWINWKRREDNTPEVPENWSIAFLNLILHPSCVDLLTPEELSQAKFMQKVGTALRFYHNLEVTVKVIDAESVDGNYKDYSYQCPGCNKNRPLTLIAADGVCGLCKYGLDYLPPMEDMHYIQVRCYGCGSIYSRNAHSYVCGHSKCYGCREFGPRSPSVTCNNCGLKFVKYYKPEEGLPNGVCCACADGERKREIKYKEYPALAHQILGSHFPTLCKSVGLLLNEGTLNLTLVSHLSETWKANTALYNIVLSVTEIEPEPLPAAPERAYFRVTLNVENIPEIWSYVHGVMQGSKVTLPECALCMEQSRLIPACGRRGCSQRVCLDCSKTWYSKNVPGSLLYQRATLCQFCCRVPAPNVLARVDPRLVPLATTISRKPLDPDAYYGWCSSCYQPAEVGTRACAAEAPTLKNYKCSGCLNPLKDVHVVTKDCPGCSVATSKIGGCNHMACTCGAHWCWECGHKAGSSEEAYKHMWDSHGRIFEGAEGYVEAEDDDAA